MNNAGSERTVVGLELIRRYASFPRAEDDVRESGRITFSASELFDHVQRHSIPSERWVHCLTSFNLLKHPHLIFL